MQKTRNNLYNILQLPITEAKPRWWKRIANLKPQMTTRTTLL